MNNLIIAVVIASTITAAVAGAAALTVWSRPWGYIHGPMMGHEHMVEYENIRVSGRVIDVSKDEIIVKAGKPYIVNIEGEWIVDYDNGTNIIVGRGELLSKYLRNNDTVMIIGYIEHDSDNIIPREIIIVNREYILRSINDVEAEECPCHIGIDEH